MPLSRPCHKRCRPGGTFREVIPPERLVYTWQWEAGVPESRESLVVVEFRDHGDETRVVLIHKDLAAPPPPPA
jgi:uncharacterized protein YndB with AHSA1/START domain